MLLLYNNTLKFGLVHGEILLESKVLLHSNISLNMDNKIAYVNVNLFTKNLHDGISYRLSLFYKLMLNNTKFIITGLLFLDFC